MAGNGTVVELRVHGVSGTPLEAMLGCPTELIERRAGDDSAGFYRRQEWIVTAVATGEPDRWRSVMEAYSWGGLTSGRASRAVWLLFLPFIFINLAHWMLPPATRQRRAAAAISVGLLRLIALSFTLALMLAVAVAVMDVMVWQCMSLDYCGSRLGPLSFISSQPRGVQTALSAVPLVVVIAVLWLLGREDMRFPGKPPPDPAVTKDDVPLQEPTFWNADGSVQRLRACHVMAWAAGLAALTLAVPVRHAGSPGVRAASVGLLVANGALLAIAIGTTAWNTATARGGRSNDWLTPPLLQVRWLSLGLLGASLIWVAVADVNYPPAPTHLPGLRGAIYVLLGVQIVLLILLLLFIARCRGSEPSSSGGYTPTLNGFTAWFVALLAWLIGGVFSIGVGLLTTQVLGEAELSTDIAKQITTGRADILASETESFEAKAVALGADAPLIVPPPYIWAAVAIAALIVVALIGGVWVYRRVIGKTTKAQLRGVLEDYPAERHDFARAREVARSRAWALLTNDAAKIVAVLALLAVVEIAGLAAWYLSDSRGFEKLMELPSGITAVSVFVTASLAAGLVLLVVLSYRNRQLRRLVAVLWDIATFWPRANHPLTPPSYGGRTVFELLVRVRTLVNDGDTRVVLAAHSQGSIIAAATLLHDKGRTSRVGLLTFGSPLRRLYAQNFPAYFGTEALRRLQDWQGEPQRSPWINLWAHSDPIGGWVIDDLDRDLQAALEHVDFRLTDVEDLKMQPDATYRPILGHSGFWIRPEYGKAMKTLDSVLLPPGAAADTSATAPPTEKML